MFHHAFLDGHHLGQIHQTSALRMMSHNQIHRCPLFTQCIGQQNLLHVRINTHHHGFHFLFHLTIQHARISVGIGQPFHIKIFLLIRIHFFMVLFDFFQKRVNFFCGTGIIFAPDLKHKIINLLEGERHSV
ncbi:MAG: hypothetical protein ACD_28C00132G0010 [uncultured bacterium]|nr:MAG: hypothetical protein ACD_28C00132G0010 [uncultured bacterium]